MAARILIVEDEVLIADNLKTYLIKMGYEIVGIAISYDEAKSVFQEKQPDLVLLDIRLYGEQTGIDFAYYIQQLDAPKPFIYLTSQMDLKSIHSAKKTFPSGYLSKPIQKDNLLATIEIALHKFIARPEKTQTLSLYDGTNNYLTPYNDILYLKAEHVYVHVHLTSNSYIIQRGGLKELLDRLPEDQFIQTHRSYAVNLNHVQKWETQYLYTRNIEIPISRSRRDYIQSILTGR